MTLNKFLTLSESQCPTPQKRAKDADLPRSCQCPGGLVLPAVSSPSFLGESVVSLRIARSLEPACRDMKLLLPHSESTSGGFTTPCRCCCSLEGLLKAWDLWGHEYHGLVSLQGGHATLTAVGGKRVFDMAFLCAFACGSLCVGGLSSLLPCLSEL